VVTDLHYAEKEPLHNRFYQQTRRKLRDAVNEFINQKLDFVVELGDLKDMNHDRDAASALRFLDDIESDLQSFGGKVYHVLGNHDMDCISKEEFLSHTTNPGKARGRSYYSFKARGVQFIVLDANFNEDRSPYCRGNFKWQEAFIPQEELDWLRKELQRSKKPVVVLSHQLLDNFSGAPKSVCIGNADKVVELLEASGRVLAVLQGHHHSGHYSQRNCRSLYVDRSDHRQLVCHGQLQEHQGAERGEEYGRHQGQMELYRSTAAGYRQRQRMET